jgi:hypothetical protein
VTQSICKRPRLKITHLTLHSAAKSESEHENAIVRPVVAREDSAPPPVSPEDAALIDRALDSLDSMGADRDVTLDRLRSCAGRMSHNGLTLKVDCDLQPTLMASSLYRFLATRIGRGYESAQSRHLFNAFIHAGATIAVDAREVVVAFRKRAHNPLLLAAGFDKTDVAIPWLGRRHLRFILG